MGRETRNGEGGGREKKVKEKSGNGAFVNGETGRVVGGREGCYLQVQILTDACNYCAPQTCALLIS